MLDVKKLQENGVFDTCVMRESPSEVETLGIGISKGILLRTDDEQPRADPESIIRSYGPQYAAVTHKVSDGTIGGEDVRWEYDFDRKRKRWIGIQFKPADMVRALSGISSDRFADALRRSPGEAVDTIHSALGRMPINANALARYFERLRSHKGEEVAWKTRIPFSLDEERHRKLTAIGAAACSAEAQKEAECRKRFADSVERTFRD